MISRDCGGHVRISYAAVVAVVTLVAATSGVDAQVPTATSATLGGTARDASGALVPGATVVLLDRARGAAAEAVTDSSGRYTFASVAPGQYTVTVSLPGFRQAVLPEVRVEVGKAYTVDVILQVGELSESVEVKPTSAVELQKLDSTIATTLSAEMVTRLPNPTRDLTSIQFNQPLATPYQGADASRTRAGAVAGSRTDQNVYLLDGIDVSDNVVGSTFFEENPSAGIPLPAESVEEFRAGATNANATFGRASGAQFVVLTKRGTNRFHGSSYLYHQNDKLNAKSWTLKRLGLAKPELTDNRFGASLGGPLVRDNLFFFGHYEGRRFPRTAIVSRLVPTDTLKSGILQFRDAAGNINAYDLRSLDPRGIGLNPVVRDLWATLPAGNDPSLGDGVNVTGFTSSVDTPINTDNGVVRIDYNLTTNWRLDGSARAGRILETGAAQVDIGGILSGQRGIAVGTENLPRRSRFVSVGLSGVLTNAFTNDLRAGWVKSYWGFGRVNPAAQVSSADMALNIASTLVDEPLDVETGRSRSQTSDSRTFQLTNNATWVKGSHTMSMGGSYRRIYWYFSRNDLLVGPLTALVANVGSGTFVTIPSAFRPPTCGSGVTAGCVQSADVGRWNQLYAGTLGLVNDTGVLGVRNGQLQALAPGTFLDVDTAQNAYELYFNDTWLLGPSLTLNLGVNYQWQSSPKDIEDRFSYLIDSSTGEILSSQTYLDRVRAAALRGQIYNPTIGFLPLRDSGRNSYYDTDWSNLGPRASAAWNPSFTGGWLNKLFGDRKSVIRGGYSLAFDRQNSINLLSWGMGVGYASATSLNGPLCNAAGRPGIGCDPSGSSPGAAFRVGIDGPTPAPIVTSATSPVVPSTPFELVITRSVDPFFDNGRTHSLNLTLQRELPWNTIAETGGVFRFGRNLSQGYVMSSVPYFFLDSASGQSFAQGYDLVAQQLRSGVAPANVTPQPWFENLVGAGQTVSLASRFTANFIEGNVSSLWLNLDAVRTARGLPPLSNEQIQTLWQRSDGGRSNYYGWFVSIRKRYSAGLTFNANYTLSWSYDQIGVAQNSSTALSSSFDPDIDYGPSFFDRRHVFNATWLYDLPFGRSGGRLSGLTGGWFVAGVFVANSGVPLDVCQRAGVYGGGLQFVTCTGAIPKGDLNLGNSVHSGVAGSNGVGTSGNPATGGTGLNIFADPAAAFASFRPVQLAQDTRAGRGVLRGLPRWNVDLSFGKRTRLASTWNAVFTMDVLNAFNTVQYSNPTLNATSPATFGVITQQGNDPRAVQLGLRLEF